MSTPPDIAYSAPVIYPRAPATNGSDLATPSNINPENPPWGVLSAIVTWLTSIALLFLVPNVLVIPYLLSHYRGVSMPTEKVLFADKTFVLLFVSGWLPAHLITLVLIWAVATRFGKFPVREVLGLNWPPSFGVWKSIGLAISLYLAATFVTGWFGGQPTELDRFLTSSRATALLLAFVAVATAPLVEELIYRGLLYSALQRAIGRWLAVVVVSSMFAGLHVWQYRQNLGVIISISLLSVVLTMIRARTGRLLPCFVVHLVFNGIQSLIIVLEPYLRAVVEHWRPQPTPGVLIHILHFLG